MQICKYAWPSDSVLLLTQCSLQMSVKSIIKQLKRSKFGYCIGSLHICLFYVDDIVLLLSASMIKVQMFVNMQRKRNGVLDLGPTI